MDTECPQRKHDHKGNHVSAIHRKRIKATEWFAIKCQEVNRTDADKNVQSHRKQARAERS